MEKDYKQDKEREYYKERAWDADIVGKLLAHLPAIVAAEVYEVFIKPVEEETDGERGPYQSAHKHYLRLPERLHTHAYQTKSDKREHAEQEERGDAETVIHKPFRSIGAQAAAPVGNLVARREREQSVVAHYAVVIGASEEI